MAKFLVLAKPIPGLQPQPTVPGRVQKMVAAHQQSKTWAQQAAAKGQVTEMYAVANNPLGYVGAGIGEAQGAEEISQQLAGHPMAPYLHFEILPLTDFNQQMDTMAKAIPTHFHP